MVFVYAPTILIVLPEHFTLMSFLQVSITCATGVFLIGTAVAGYFITAMGVGGRILMIIGGLLLVAPSGSSDLIALLVVGLTALPQVIRKRAEGGTSHATR